VAQDKFGWSIKTDENRRARSAPAKAEDTTMKLSNRFTLLASGLIGLSALAASPAAAQNASVCRSSVGVIGDFAQRCLTRPDGTLGGLINNAVGTVNAARDQLNTDTTKQVESGDNPRNDFSYSRDTQGNLVVKIYKNGVVDSKIIYATVAGRATAASLTETTRKAPSPSRTGMAPTPTRAVDPTYATTTTKSATGQTIVTNDHRAPAGAAPKPNSPPPAAAAGSRNNSVSAQSTQTSMARDHRHQ
jgi:hypothetical protein